MDKAKVPDDAELQKSLGKTFDLWQTIKEIAHLKYPEYTEEWNFPGEKYGWSYRIKDKKRAILYLLPRENYFKVSFVFGQKATSKILESDISPKIKNDLNNARVYAEGRGISLGIEDRSLLENIVKLIDIKLTN
jgi:hypothetical protein